MGSVNILQSGRFSAPKALKRAFRLAAIAALALGFAPSRAAAQNTLTGCQQITSAGTYVLQPGFAVNANPCFVVSVDNVEINLNGQTIDMTGYGNSGVAIQTGTTNNTTIIGGGTIVTAYSSSSAGAAIEATGGTGLTITGVNIENGLNTNLCLAPSAGTASTNQEWGTGISISGVTGASISSNDVCFYQTGISVQNSNIPNRGTGSITGNELNWNTYSMVNGTSGIYSAGLVLSNSSGWTVSQNVIEYNGSMDPSSLCSPTANVLTCSPAVQIINGSSGNTITYNDPVDDNFGPGIMTGSDTSKNSITFNTLGNNDLYDLYEDGAGHGNKFQNNTCGTVGGSLTLSRAC